MFIGGLCTVHVIFFWCVCVCCAESFRRWSRRLGQSGFHFPRVNLRMNARTNARTNEGTNKQASTQARERASKQAGSRQADRKHRHNWKIAGAKKRRCSKHLKRTEITGFSITFKICPTFGLKSWVFSQRRFLGKQYRYLLRRIKVSQSKNCKSKLLLTSDYYYSPDGRRVRKGRSLSD